ncbi:hypothetical protein Ctob_004548 [Chrysochromulina tobinii]|uniref:Uncharacterized protein n=1 Tax=Chrysochromulina tobinii TaxID=1460289 RepID=A0A0M0JJ97_9EUKA|nr:hypothetical protein Ctob_004548 [Chrysochromulina tobinii]|eukprot:KOO26407.1 hypothetical protein Ctob_004548 [Chrysochromulina sp. CCMP291]
MIGTAAPLLEGMIKALELTEPEMRADGEKIYAQKPNLGEHGITWSQENYAHKGLQIEYLRLKSIQRFTESYACMQRAYNKGAFAKLQRATADGAAPGSIPYSIVSLGGGPGFELLGAKAFCDEYLPAAAVTLKSLDLEASWRPCAEGLGLAFDEWDVNDGDGLMAASGVGRIDLALISYVYYHYMSTPHCAEWLANRLRGGSIGAVLIICRFESHERNISMMKERGVHTTKLMVQPRFSSRASDDRQLLYTSADDPAPEPLPAEEQLEMSYPNVPHEDQKDPRDRSYSSSALIDGGGEGGTAEYGADESAAAPPENPEARRDRRLGQVPDALRDALRAVEPDVAEPALAFFCLDGGHSGARELVLEADGDMHEIVLKLDFEAKAWKRVRRKVKPS